MLEALLEILVEFLLQFVLELLAELGLHAARLAVDGRKNVHPALAVPGYIALGCFFGWLSLVVFPHKLVDSSPIPGLSLIVAPTLAGLGMWGVGWIRRRNDGVIVRLDRFGYGFLFAFVIAVIRFVYAT